LKEYSVKSSVLKPGPTRLVGPWTRGCSGSGRLHDWICN